MLNTGISEARHYWSCDCSTRRLKANAAIDLIGCQIGVILVGQRPKVPSRRRAVSSDVSVILALYIINYLLSHMFTRAARRT